MSQAGKQIEDDLNELTSIKERLLSSPEKDVCEEMGGTMDVILKRLGTNIAELSSQVQASNSQNIVQDNTQNREPSQETCTWFSFLSKKPEIKVQIMNTILTQTTKMFISTMVDIMADYDFQILRKNDTFDKQIPLIVVCPNSSRLLPDLELALETIEQSFEHVVIIIHTGSEANLPAIPSGDRIKNYERVTFIDIGYEQHRGIYKCNYNIDAIKTLKAFIKRFYASIK